MNKAMLENGPYTITLFRASKGVAYVTIESHDKTHIGITKAELTIDCKSANDAADLLSYLSRDLDFTLALTLDEKG